METNEKLTLFLVVIAIFLSAFSLTIALETKAKQENFVTRENINQEYPMISNSVSTQDFTDFYTSLVDYHTCITAAEREFINCVNQNAINLNPTMPDTPGANCDVVFVSKRDDCEDKLRPN